MLRCPSALGLLLPALAAAFSCASPTLPLPPPDAPSVQAGLDADHVALWSPCGGAEGGATVVIFNTNPTVPNDKAVSASIANTCGAWDAPSVYAHNGDVLSVTQQIAGLLSGPATVQVQLP